MLLCEKVSLMQIAGKKEAILDQATDFIQKLQGDVEKAKYDYCQLKIQLMASVAAATESNRLEYVTKASLESLVSSESISWETDSDRDPSEVFLASPTDRNCVLNVNDEEEGLNRHEDMGEDGEVHTADNKETEKCIYIDCCNEDIIVDIEDVEDEELSDENKENILDVEDEDDPYENDLGCREDFSVHFCPVCPSKKLTNPSNVSSHNKGQTHLINLSLRLKSLIGIRM